MAQPEIKWAVEYPAALGDGSASSDKRLQDYSQRTTSPAFYTKGAAELVAKALVQAYREAQLVAHTDSGTIDASLLYRGGASFPPGHMQVLVKPVIV